MGLPCGFLANAAVIRDEHLIPGLGRFSGGGVETHSHILARRFSWTEELGGYSLCGHKELDMTEVT